MDLDQYSDEDLLQSIEAEIAKSLGELKCAQGDINKINSRLKFALVALHTIKRKQQDKKE
jgi:hypothetical protein